MTFAQGGAMADLKFEEAETAFSNADYKSTISKLDEFDKLFGSLTAKSLYLRIISQNQLLNESEPEFSTLISLRKNATSYLNAMESEGLDDKFREVYKINEKIKQLPEDEASWKKSINDKEDIKRQIASKLDNTVWLTGIKLGDSYTTLKQNFPTLSKSGDSNDGRVLWDVPEFYQYQDFSKPSYIYTRDNIVKEYNYHLPEYYRREDVNGKSTEFVNKIKAQCSTAEIFSKTNEDGFLTYLIIVPYAKTIIQVWGGTVPANTEYHTQVRVSILAAEERTAYMNDTFGIK